MNAKTCLAALAVLVLAAPGCATIRMSSIASSDDSSAEAASTSQMRLRLAAAELVDVSERRGWARAGDVAAAARQAFAVLLHGLRSQPDAQDEPGQSAAYLAALSAEGPVAAGIEADVTQLRAHVARVNDAAEAVAHDADADATGLDQDLRSLEQAMRVARGAHAFLADAAHDAGDGLASADRAAIDTELEATAREIDMMSVRADDLGARRSAPSTPQTQTS